MKRAGRVSLVGAGPGDPELITVRGLRVLEEADIVVYDRLVAAEILAHARPDAELIYVGKRRGKHSVPQEEITRLLVERGRSGRRVARLKGGDPFIFGRGGEEIEALTRAGIPAEVIPGVTAASGAAAYCGFPLTARGKSSSVTFVTGHEDPSKDESAVDWEALARTGGTLVVYMGMGRLEEIVSNLLVGGLSPETPAVVVCQATTPEQTSIGAPLGEIARAVRERGLTPPALVIIGQVARLEERAAWFESLPLFGRWIVVTRSRAQSSALARGIRELGAKVLQLPTIEVAPPADPAPLDDALRRLETYDYIIFTSVNAVTRVMERLLELGRDLRAFRNARICAIGQATAAGLLDAGLRADVVPKEFTAEGLLEALSGEDVKGKRILLPRAAEAREVLPEGLRARGANVDVREAYRTVRPDASGGSVDEAIGALVEGKADLVTFTSSSTVRNLVALLGPEGTGRARAVQAAAIGPVTAKTAREAGFSVVVEPRLHTIPALVDSVRSYFVRSRDSGPAEERAAR